MTATFEVSFASELACRALKLKPAGTPASSFWGSDRAIDGMRHCVCCGRPLQSDTPCMEFAPPDSFQSHALLVPDSTLTCGWCAASSVQPVLRLLQRTVITADGLYPIGTDDARAWFLLTPPTPPFAVCVQTRSPTSAFHLHWSTPVTLNPAYTIVRVDDRLLRIRRPLLMQAIDDCQELATAMAALPTAKPNPLQKPARHPFRSLDRNLSSTGHGQMSRAAQTLRQSPDLSPTLAERFDRLSLLGDGERWALATLVKANAPTPARPDAIKSMPLA